MMNNALDLRRRPAERSRRPRSAGILVAMLAFGIAGMVVAVAALLNVSPARLGSSTVATAGCDNNGLTATPTFSYSNGAYVIDSVELAGVANGCRNKDYAVALVGVGGKLGEQVMSRVPASSFGGTNNANTLSIDFTGASPRVYADAVTAIHVVISD